MEGVRGDIEGGAKHGRDVSRAEVVGDTKVDAQVVEGGVQGCCGGIGRDGLGEARGAPDTGNTLKSVGVVDRERAGNEDVGKDGLDGVGAAPVPGTNVEAD